MLPEIKNAYLEGRLMLLLGAGASKGSRDSSNQEILMSDDLARELAEEMEWPYCGDTLGSVYSAAKAKDSSRLYSFLEKRLINTKPSRALETIASFRWSRIYTLNIDDCTEKALRKAGNQRTLLLERNSSLEDIDLLFKSVQLIKLNGSADRPENGFIFSPQEYAKNTNLPIWYRELRQDYSNYMFVFIGSKLDEPLLFQVMANTRSIERRDPVQGYVITPSASHIEKLHLESLKLTHVSGTIENFANWLHQEMPRRPSSWALATARRPELRNLPNKWSEAQQRAFNSVIVVSKDTLPCADKKPGAIREFYKGYKPCWNDILYDVPAELDFIKDFFQLVEEGHEGGKCIMLVGFAGSGKSTALMTIALRVSGASNTPVYFLREAVTDVKKVILSLEEVNDSKFYLFIDKIDSMHNEIAELLAEGQTKHICIVASERLNIWNKRVKSVIEPYTKETFKVEKISKADASRILKNLKTFGPWTRLGKMKPEKRIAEIYKNADRQLLIGLMETTTGLGFTQIIKNDFKDIENEQHQKFLIIVGFASIHRSTLSSHIVGSALLNLGIEQDVNVMTRETKGVVVVSNGLKYSARHPVYIRELFKRVVSAEMIRDCLVAVLQAFSDYETPVIKKVGKADGIVFKSIINHHFVKDMMGNDGDKIRSIYQTFETKFYVDGLYWLQYGLALRDIGVQQEALEKLKTARQAYISPQIEHAYAQQLMIIANLSQSWEDAEPLLNEAIEMLQKQSHVVEAANKYPIVTLAEGHISIADKFLGKDKAKEIALEYSKELLKENSKHPNDRLKEGISRIADFEKTGIWKPAREKSDFDED